MVRSGEQLWYSTRLRKFMREDVDDQRCGPWTVLRIEEGQVYLVLPNTPAGEEHHWPVSWLGVTDDEWPEEARR